jgi:hypothetical protein
VLLAHGTQHLFDRLAAAVGVVAVLALALWAAVWLAIKLL